MRGDYLAIATLGFGEIIRILAGSDLLQPWLGGPRGHPEHPEADRRAADHFLAGPDQIYYIALACAAVIAFVAWRLRGSRLGRAWLAIREDEDVAEALGVNLVQTKLLAYMLGAAFAGLGGAIFAALIGASLPEQHQAARVHQRRGHRHRRRHGQHPGRRASARIVLIGLPELFREFSEYRFLFYGIALIIMMRFRPEGLLPSRTRCKRELQIADHDASADGRGSTRPRSTPSRRAERQQPGRWPLLEATRRDQALRRPARRQRARLHAGAGRRSSASSAPTAPARRRSSTASPASTASTRAGSSSTARRSTRCDPTRSPTWARPDVPEHPAVRGHDRDGERARRRSTSTSTRPGSARSSGRTRRAAEEERAAETEARRLLDYVGLQRQGRHPGRQACPTATSVDWRSPGRSPPSRGCCCSTSRRPA